MNDIEISQICTHTLEQTVARSTRDARWHVTTCHSDASKETDKNFAQRHKSRETDEFTGSERKKKDAKTDKDKKKQTKINSVRKETRCGGRSEN